MNSFHAGSEQAAAAAFTRQAPVFDQLFGADPIIQYKRQRVRDHMSTFLQFPAHILELNAGTGEDAIYFARQGHQVHATDISVGMQDTLYQKVKASGLTGNITQELCSFTELEHLSNSGPFDHIFSNFAGLNCTGQLQKVLDSFSYLVKPGGHVTLVMLPSFCLWEFLLLFRGKFKPAFRRFSGRKGTTAHMEGTVFRCWYYDPGFIRKRLANTFEVVSLEGLCTIVPPSYMEKFAERYPRLFQFLVKKENVMKKYWPWRLVGDYYIITLKRKDI
jgi:ubiquinone/menaquinone biosynthesis C-methylase UbiE